MLAVAQALVRKPTLLMLDEPSVGLSPLIVTELFAVFRRLRDEGMTILLVEQVVDKAMAISDHTYVLRTGRIVAGGASHTLREDDTLLRAYMG
jgi:branched-chain amino acid transport system ATP-binding protein